jgi:hypothetical protein
VSLGADDHWRQSPLRGQEQIGRVEIVESERKIVSCQQNRPAMTGEYAAPQGMSHALIASDDVQVDARVTPIFQELLATGERVVDGAILHDDDFGTTPLKAGH